MNESSDSVEWDIDANLPLYTRDYLNLMKKRSAYVLFPSTKDEVTIVAVDDTPDCPDCVQGKHGNCSGTSWNDTLDKLDMCPCEVRGHAKS